MNRTGRLEPKYPMRIVAHIANAVHGVSEYGLASGNLKPSNIIIHPNGLPVLVGF